MRVAPLDRNQFTFLAPLDTVLKATPRRIEPVLRFLSLLQRHFVVSDTQVVDHLLFRQEPLDRDVATVFEHVSADGMPLFVVSKRDERSLREIVLESMACAGSRKRSAFPMHFSSLPSAGRTKLKALVQSGELTAKRFFDDIGYPEHYLNRISRIELRAGLSQDFIWNAQLRDPANYLTVVQAILRSKSLEEQAALPRQARVRGYFRELCQRVIEMDATSFSRTVLQRELTRQRRNRGKDRHLSRIPVEGFNEVLEVVEAVGTFGYLRNFADWNDYSFLVDRQLWLPSSVVNKELATERPQAEETDELVEACLGVHDGFAEGRMSESFDALHALLAACRFTKEASWEKVIRLRARGTFWDNLLQIDRCKGNDQANAIREHVVWCLKELLPRRVDWESIAIDAICGVAGAAATAPQGLIAAVVGFATAVGGAVLRMTLRGGRQTRQAMLFDQIAAKAARELRRRDLKLGVDR